MLYFFKGAYAIKLAQLSNIHPIIAVARRREAFVGELIDRSRGDTIVDYRNGDEKVVSDIKSALKERSIADIHYAFDAISEKGSYQKIGQILAPRGSKITLVLPGRDYSDIPGSIEHSITSVSSVHADIQPDSSDAKAGVKIADKEFGFLSFRFFSRGLQEGWFTAHPHEVIPGGLNGLQKGLENLKNGVNSATKYVFRIEDTK
jgi:NADPH:quinone reductase